MHMNLPLHFYTLTNASGASVTFCDLGAAITSISVPDRDGNLANVALGYEDPNDYFTDSPCFGKTIGRYANRIAKGKFTLNGKEYSLAINNGPNHLHGGPGGYAFKFWNLMEQTAHSLVFTLMSRDGDEGYPGDLQLTLTYTWTEDNALIIRYRAVCNQDTLVNLTNHSYFNLSGAGSGSVLDHHMKIYAQQYLPIDETSIPYGAPKDVEGSPFDFRQCKPIGQDIEADCEQLRHGTGYDHCWVLDKTADDRFPGCHLAGRLCDHKSGRKLTVYTTQPGLQVYTGNWLEGNGKSPNGEPHHNRWGVALECQNFPNSPNEPSYPSPVLKAEEPYDQTIVFAFSVKQGHSCEHK